MFDRDVVDFAKRQNWVVIEILHKSEHKKTVILKIVFNGRTCIAKLYLKAAPVEIKEAFTIEAEYYSLLSGVAHIPELIQKGDGYLVLEYVEGESILTFAMNKSIAQKQILSMASEVEKSIQEFNSIPNINNRTIGKLEACRLVLSRFKDLCLSGPVGTRASLYKRQQLKCLYYFSLPFIMLALVRHVPKLLSSASMKGRRYHGDLHMNNFLISEKLAVHLIDFECAKEKPLMFLDLAYSCATFIAVFKNKEKVMPVFRRSLDISESSYASFEWLLDLLVSFALLNPRFSAGAPSKIKLTSLVKMLLGR